MHRPPPVAIVLTRRREQWERLEEILSICPCLIAVLFINRKSKFRASINKIGLSLSSIYLVWTLCAKFYVNSKLEDALEKEGIAYLSYQSRPTPFNTILWTFNVETEESFRIHYYSLFDEKFDLEYREFSKNHDLLKKFRNHPSIEQLIFLTKGYYTIEDRNGSLIMNDLRFGLLDGGDEHSEFVFSYKIKKDEDGLKIEQVEQKMDKAKDALQNLWNRLRGIKSS